MSDGLVISLLNGLSYGLLLFMLSAGLTLIFSLMGVLNFAHASFYMLGAYLGHAVSAAAGFAAALLLAPLLVGALGGVFERTALRRVRPHGHVAELLATFGLAYVLLEVVQLIWGRGPLEHPVPPALSGPLLTLGGTQFPLYRGFIMLVALGVWAALAVVLARTRVLRALEGQTRETAMRLRIRRFDIQCATQIRLTLSVLPMTHTTQARIHQRLGG